jgi:esterase/lipase
MKKAKLGRKVGIVLINGFTPHPNDFEPLMPFFHKTKHVLALSLPGDPNDISSDTYVPFKEWLEVSLKAIQTLRESTEALYLMSFSIGAVPALYFASKIAFDKISFLSPALEYATFDESTTSLVRMVRSTVLSKGKSDPVNSVRTLRFLKDFAQAPGRNLGQLFRVRVGPFMNPSNILLFPIVTLFEEELSNIDEAGARLVKKIAYKKYQDYDFQSDDLTFGEDNITYERTEEIKKTAKPLQLYRSLFNRVKRILPPEFTNLSSESVYNMMRLLAYCNKFSTKIDVPMRIYYGHFDPNVKPEAIRLLLEQNPSTNAKIVTYPTNEHHLFSSPYYIEATKDSIQFLLEENEEPSLNS